MSGPTIIKPPLGRKLNYAHPLAQGLVGCWLMNEEAGDEAADSSSNRNDGALVADTHFVPGKFGPALDFDGTGDYVSIPDDKSIQVKDDMTICGQVKLRNVPQTIGHYLGITNKLDYGNDEGYDFCIGKNGLDKLIIVLWVGNSKSLASSYGLIKTDTFYHIAVVKKGTTAYFYIDGNSDGSDTCDIGHANSGAPLYFARDTTYTNGIIDNVMIYNRALSPSEIRQSFISPFCMFRRKPIIPIVDISGNVTVYPAAAALTVSIQAPSIVIVQDETVEPASMSMTTAVIAPIITADATFTAAEFALISTIHAPSLNISIEILPSALGLTGQIIEPVVLGCLPSAGFLYGILNVLETQSLVSVHVNQSILIMSV